jgi:hypothetical protein
MFIHSFSQLNMHREKSRKAIWGKLGIEKLGLQEFLTVK